MTESNKKLVVVSGATGAQGSSVVKYLLEHSSTTYRIRALTRNPSQPSAQRLHAAGVEVVQCDFASEDSVRAALRGAHVIFANTNFWDQNSYEVEVAQGKLINRVAAGEIGEGGGGGGNLEHYVYSALMDGRGIAGGKYQRNLPYNAKAAIREDIRDEYPALWAKTTELLVSSYYQNWLKFGLVFGPQKHPDGTWLLSMPYPKEAKIPNSDTNDTGVVVDTILHGGKKYHGKTVTLVCDLNSDEERLKIWADALGVKAVFEQISQEGYQKRMEGYGYPNNLAVAVSELCSSLPYGADVLEGDDKVKAREIIPASYKLKSWKDYVKEEDWLSIL